MHCFVAGNLEISGILCICCWKCHCGCYQVLRPLQWPFESLFSYSIVLNLRVPLNVGSVWKVQLTLQLDLHIDVLVFVDTFWNTFPSCSPSAGKWLWEQVPRSQENKVSCTHVPVVLFYICFILSKLQWMLYKYLKTDFQSLHLCYRHQGEQHALWFFSTVFSSSGIFKDSFAYSWLFFSPPSPFFFFFFLLFFSLFLFFFFYNSL